MAVNLPSDQPDAAPPPEPARGEPPIMGERSRQFLRERQQNQGIAEPARSSYRVPSLEQKKVRSKLTVEKAVLFLHFALGVIWAILGVAVTLAFLGDGAAINHAGALAGVVITFYGGFCFWLAIALSVTARWAWPTAMGLSIAWLVALLYATLFQSAALAVFLPLAGFMAWGLYARKPAFRDPR